MNASWRDSATHGFNRLWYGGNRLYWLLWPLALIVAGLTVLRRRAYALGWLESVDVGVPLVVVGNLTAGGTGKTPLTLWLAQQLSERGFSVGIVCRGYGGEATQWPQCVTAASDASVVGDEAKLLAAKSHCPVVAGRDRVVAVRSLLDAASVDVILSDDGLQHYRLRRDFEIAVIDGSRGLGNGLCLPAGPLREPAARLAKVDAVVVNGGDRDEAGGYRASLRLVHLRNLNNDAVRPLSDFSGRVVHAVAAIGNPGRFFAALEHAGISVVAHAHADHAALSMADLHFADDLPILITEKDAVKCEQIGAEDVWVVVAELEFAPGDAERLLGTIEQRLGLAGKVQ